MDHVRRARCQISSHDGIVDCRHDWHLCAAIEFRCDRFAGALAQQSITTHHSILVKLSSLVGVIDVSL